MNSIIPIKGAVQYYNWGRPGPASIVAALAGNSADIRPHAELWFGAHPKAPSAIVGSDRTLDQLIQADPVGMLGQRVTDGFCGTLPFLFKILSIGSALSIQAHPDLARAADLRRTRPEHYPDSSHKPEIAVALSGLTFLAGFVSTKELIETVGRLPELELILPQAAARLAAAGDNAVTIDLFSGLFTAEDKALANCAEQVRSRLLGLKELTGPDSWFLKLFEPFGPAGDPGLFCFYLMRLERLSPGQALYTGPNIVHAYLDGEIVECMANSDNVVRAGLTEKYRDVETLISMVKGAAEAQPQKINIPSSTSTVASYQTPAAEFLVQQIKSGPAPTIEGAPGELELLVSLDGAGSLDFDGKSAAVVPGSAFFKSARNGGYKLNLARGTCYRVLVPQ